MKGTTTTGFNFNVDDEIRDDMELLEGLIAIDNGDLQALPKVLMSILGQKQKDALYDHCRSEKGRVSSTKVMSELKEIFESADKELKN